MANLDRWEPENPEFWEATGKGIARRNLWISVPCLLVAFSVWMIWSIIAVQMQNLKFPFDQPQLYFLPAVAGLVGATLRIPNSFMISLCNGRNAISLNTMLLLAPAIGAGIALQDRTTPYWVFVVLAGLSGVGGGNFASSMSNISFFYPKKMQGAALGLNAGLGNLGVSLMQFALPWAMTLGLFGAMGGAALLLPEAVGPKPAGTEVFIQNCGLFWVPILVVLGVVSWFGMTNLPIHAGGPALFNVGKVLWLTLLGFLAAGAGVYLLWVLTFSWKIWVVLPVTILLTVLFMRFLTPSAMKANLQKQFSIFSNKHNWVMTVLYVMTFGSFIGYSAAFPKLIQDIFGKLPGGAVNPNAPNPLYYAWLGPLVGSLVRPLGGWVSDKLGGARVTQWNTVVMIAAAFGSAYFIKAAGSAAEPQTYFLPFLGLFLLLFVTTGIGNGSTFRMIPIIFEPAKAGPVLGWTSAVAAYGACVIPIVIGDQIKNKTPEYALYGFGAFYVFCLVLNWWYYARKNAEIVC